MNDPQPPQSFVNTTVPTVAESELSWSFARSSGPGGQNVNKVNSKAILRWNVTTSPSIGEGVRARFLTRFANRVTTGGELVLHGERYRDAPRNQQDLRERLAAMIAEIATPPKVRVKRKPSRAAKQRRMDDKKIQSEKKNRRSRPDY